MNRQKAIRRRSDVSSRRKDFSTPTVRYGITTPLWDLVFRTFPNDRWQSLSDEKAAELEAGS